VAEESPQGHPGGFRAFHKEQQLGGSSRIAASFKIPLFQKYSQSLNTDTIQSTDILSAYVKAPVGQSGTGSGANDDYGMSRRSHRLPGIWLQVERRLWQFPTCG